ncbi:hypothetical protein WA158_005781 [Blastocystis sp. Blastoise]
MEVAYSSNVQFKKEKETLDRYMVLTSSYISLYTSEASFHASEAPEMKIQLLFISFIQESDNQFRLVLDNNTLVFEVKSVDERKLWVNFIREQIRLTEKYKQELLDSFFNNDVLKRFVKRNEISSFTEILKNYHQFLSEYPYSNATDIRRKEEDFLTQTSLSLLFRRYFPSNQTSSSSIVTCIAQYEDQLKIKLNLAVQQAKRNTTDLIPSLMKKASSSNDTAETHVEKSTETPKQSSEEKQDEEVEQNNNIYLWTSQPLEGIPKINSEFQFPWLYPYAITDAAIGETTTLFLSRSGDVYTYSHTSASPPLLIQQFSIYRALNNTRIISIAAGQSHFLALSDGGEVYSWGENYQGQLGLGNTISTEIPHIVGDLLNETIVEVACGYNYSCAITAGNDVYMWGCNEDGQLGIGSLQNILVPTKLTCFNKNIFKVSLGYNNTLFLTFNNELYISGRTENYQGGYTTEEYVTSPRRIEGMNKNRDSENRIIKVCTAYTTVYALTQRGDVYSWGTSSLGELGIQSPFINKNSEAPISSTTPTSVFLKDILQDGERVIDIDAKMSHVLLLTNKGGIIGWGANKNSCLNTPTNTKPIFYLPELLAPRNPKITKVIAGFRHTLYLTSFPSEDTHIVRSNGDLEVNFLSTAARKDVLRGELRNEQLWSEKIYPLFESKGQITKEISAAVKQGVATIYRGMFYRNIIGNELRISKSLYTMYINYLSDMKKGVDTNKNMGNHNTQCILPMISHGENIIQSIEKDLPRTFASYNLFHCNSNLYKKLQRVLEAFSCYRSDIGYHQAMSYIGGVLAILIDDEYQLFVAFSNMMTKYHFLAFNQQRDDLQCQYTSCFKSLVSLRLPVVFSHFQSLNIEYGFFFPWWLQRAFVSVFPLPTVLRIWDNMILEGTKYLFKVGIAILSLLQDFLIYHSSDEIYQLFTNHTNRNEVWQSRLTEQKLLYTAEQVLVPNDICKQLGDLEFEAYNYDVPNDYHM